ncbi:MAG TPA: NEW3 domain-containing protein [Bacillota bacterium]
MSLLVAMVAVPAPAAAASLELSTSYPAVLVQAGDETSFSIRVSNGLATSQTVRLSLTSVPEGWQADFRGGGRVIRSVYVAPNDDATVDLQVQVPADAQPGTYELRIQGQSAAASDSLELALTVSEEAAAVAELKAEYPVLQGPSGAEFEFRLTLENNSGADQLFALAAEAPSGWEVTFEPAFEDKQISSIPVSADGSEQIDVRIRTPEQVEAGDYKIPVTAASGGTTVTTELTITITGTYELELAPADERFSFDATAGGESRIQLFVVNSGTAPLTGISLSASPPTDWEVTFEPKEIASIPAGERQEVTMIVKPRERAIAGDYIVNVNASASQASDSAEFRVTVKTPTVWGWVGLFLVAAAVAGTFTVFRVYGRR